MLEDIGNSLATPVIHIRPHGKRLARMAPVLSLLIALHGKLWIMTLMCSKICLSNDFCFWWPPSSMNFLILTRALRRRREIQVIEVNPGTLLRRVSFINSCTQHSCCLYENKYQGVPDPRKSSILIRMWRSCLTNRCFMKWWYFEGQSSLLCAFDLFSFSFVSNQYQILWTRVGPRNNAFKQLVVDLRPRFQNNP